MRSLGELREIQQKQLDLILWRPERVRKASVA